MRKRNKKEAQNTEAMIDRETEEAFTGVASVRRKKSQVSKKKNRKVGWIISMFQLVATIILLINLLVLNVLPVKYLLLICVILLICVLITVCTQIPRVTQIGGWIFGILMIILLVIGNVYLIRTQKLLDTVTVDKEENYKEVNIVVAVLKDDQAQSMDDTLLYNFGIQKTIDRENTNATIAEIESTAGLTLTTTEFEDFSEMYDALKRGEIQAIIYNAAYNGTIEEKKPDFTENIRVLNSHVIRTRINMTTSDMNVTQEPFTIYISGIDVYGEIAQASRSDVNMLVTVNPQTKEIIMTTTPRDYWVELPNVSQGYKDKLTHAGIYGVQCSMDTLSQIYGIQIDYYVRVNFTTLKKIVDALGGVNVYSEYEFTTHYKNGGYDIHRGYNLMDGKKALAFARERYNVPGGDEQRGRDQQAVLKALIEKAMSPSILTGYMDIMDSLTGSFETNMSMNQIASLVKMQLSDNASWKIHMQSVTGSYGSEPCYSSGYYPYSIMYPGDASVYEAREKILEIGGAALPVTHPLYKEFIEPMETDETGEGYENSDVYGTEDGTEGPGYNYKIPGDGWDATDAAQERMGIIPQYKVVPETDETEEDNESLEEKFDNLSNKY